MTLSGTLPNGDMWYTDTLCICITRRLGLKHYRITAPIVDGSSFEEVVKNIHGLAGQTDAVFITIAEVL